MKMKIKYLLVAVAMIGLTSFAMKLNRAFKTNSSKIQISEEKLIAKSDCIYYITKMWSVPPVDIANKYGN
jgi:hypothetical protein